jgi:hypothetical protein
MLFEDIDQNPPPAGKSVIRCRNADQFEDMTLADLRHAVDLLIEAPGVFAQLSTGSGGICMSEGEGEVSQDGERHGKCSIEDCMAPTTPANILSLPNSDTSKPMGAF